MGGLPTVEARVREHPRRRVPPGGHGSPRHHGHIGMPAAIPPDVDCPLSGRSHAIKGRFPVQAERIINMTELKEIRCHKCGKLLAKGEALVLELKCPRCKAYNFLRAMSARPEPREGQTEMMSDAR